MAMHPSAKDEAPMSGMAIDATAQDYVRLLEDRERYASRVPLGVARRTVARRTGVATGTLENLRRGRIKGVRAWILSALRDALIREIEADIAREQHQLAILKAAHRDADHQQMAELQKAIEDKQRTLNGGT